MRIALTAALVIGVLAVFVSAHPRIPLPNPKIERESVQPEKRQGEYGGPASF